MSHRWAVPARFVPGIVSRDYPVRRPAFKDDLVAEYTTWEPAAA
jgi:hypothetical protein